MLARSIHSLVLLLLLSTQTFAQDRDLVAATAALDSCLASSEDCHGEIVQLSNLFRENPDTTAGRLLYRLGKSLDDDGGYSVKAKELYEESIHLFDQASLPCEEVKIHFSYTRLALFQGDPDVTIKRAERCLEVAEICGMDEHIAHAHSFVGASLSEQSKFQLALEHLIEAERMYNAAQDSAGQAMVLLDKAIVFNGIDDDEKARASTKEAAKIYKALGHEMSYAIALIDLCSDYLDADMTDSVERYLPVAEKIVRGRHEMALAYVNQHYGNLHKKKKEPRKALTRFNEAYEFAERTSDYEFMATLKNFIAEIYMESGADERAYQEGLISDSLARLFGSPELKLYALMVKAKTAHGVGKSKMSYDAFLDYIDLNDSLRGIDRQNEISVLEEAFEAEQRENKIRVQQQENALLEEKNKVASNRILGLVIAIALLSALAAALVNRQRLKVMAKEAKIKVKDLENENLNQKLEFKNRELSAKALQIAQKNEVLSNLKKDLEKMAKTKENEACIVEVVNNLRIERSIAGNWEQFTQQFTELNPSFYKNLTAINPDLSKSDMRLAALLRMNLGSKDIASMLNISNDGVKKARYRLRKKLELRTDDSLEQEILNI